MIASNKKEDSVEYEILREIAKEIYKDQHRIDILVATTKEYVEKIINIKSLNIDSLIKDIDREIRANPRYITKINIRHLKKFLISQDHTNEETYLLQLRIIEYFKNELRYYNSKKEKRKTLNRFRKLREN